MLRYLASTPKSMVEGIINVKTYRSQSNTKVLKILRLSLSIKNDILPLVLRRMVSLMWGSDTGQELFDWAWAMMQETLLHSGVFTGFRTFLTQRKTKE